MTDRDEALREALEQAKTAESPDEAALILAGAIQHALAYPRLPWVACEERLPEHKGELSIAHNEHRSSYCDAETWLRELEVDQQELARPDEIQRMIQADSIWHVQWYPDTPNGFCRRFAADLASALPTPEEGEG